MKLTIRMIPSSDYSRMYDYAVCRGSHVVAVYVDLKNAVAMRGI